MKSSPKNIILILTFILAVFTTCKDQWEDHNALRQGVLSENLVQLVSDNPSLSVFAGYLKQTGYDKVLALSRSYTVWAPNNNALSNIDQSIVTDSVKLKKFVANHISYQEYPTNQEGKTVKMKMLSGKNIEYVSNASQIEGANIETASSNLFCKNGILHVIASPLYPKDNLWEYFNGTTGDNMQKNIMSYVAQVFDPNLSKRKGVNALGQTIYDTVWTYKNIFLADINDISNEDSVYTFFVLTDTAFQTEYNKMKPYLNDTTAFSADNIDFYTKKDVVKDIVVRGKFTADKLPTVLTSTQGISIPMANVKIENQYEASNGIVYMVSKFDIPLANKIKDVKLEGENFFSTYEISKKDSTLQSQGIPLLGIRARSWASGGLDLNIPGGANGPKIPYLTVGYRTPRLYTLTYQVYWHAVNDFQSGSFTQKLAINALKLPDIQAITYKGDTLVRYKTINYSANPMIAPELHLGKIVNNQYGNIRLYVVSDANASTGPIVLDYIKLVPEVPAQ